MFDGLLSIGCALDWITPTVAFIQDFLYGPACDFGIPANLCWGRKEINWLLRQHGVKVWGLMYNFNGDILMFSVHRKQADLTYDLLQWAGIPVLYAPAQVYDLDDVQVVSNSIYSDVDY